MSWLDLLFVWMYGNLGILLYIVINFVRLWNFVGNFGKCLFVFVEIFLICYVFDVKLWFLGKLVKFWICENIVK